MLMSSKNEIVYSDSELVKLLSQDNSEIFECIYRSYASKLYGYARKNIALKEDCEELIQEVFESLWARRTELAHVSELSPYLYRMVKYKIIRYFQHKNVVKRYEEHYKIFETIYESSDNRDIIDVQSAIMLNISDLPERCQYALKLRLFEGLSNAEIAKHMNIGKTTVENYMVKALNHLKANKKQLSKLINT